MVQLSIFIGLALCCTNAWAATSCTSPENTFLLKLIGNDAFVQKFCQSLPASNRLDRKKCPQALKSTPYAKIKSFCNCVSNTCCPKPCGTLTKCPKLPCGNTCVDTTKDVKNCGACGTKCPSQQKCIGSTCQCGSGQLFCNNKCVDSTDPSTCGSCTNKCAAGQKCSAGTCQCDDGKIFCGGQCVDSNDPNTCGSCTNKCTSDQTCNSGTCECEAGKIFCNGQCVSNNDPSTCGSCTNMCIAPKTTCTNQACTCPFETPVDCGSNCCPTGNTCGTNGECIVPCKDLNDSCTADGDCCDGNLCASGTCQAPATCASPQFTCRTSCCNEGQVCGNNGFCRAPCEFLQQDCGDGRCARGDRGGCRVDADCCSRSCFNTFGAENGYGICNS